MARGFLSGALWGVVVAGVGVGTISIVTGPVMSPKPQVGQDVAGTAGEPPGVRTDDLPGTSARDGVSPQRPSPGIPEPTSGAEAASGLADTASPGRPETGEADALRPAPEAGQGDTILLPGAAPVAPGQDVAQPSVPAADELSISNNPAQPPAPVPSLNEAAPQLGDDAPEADAGAIAPRAESPVEEAGDDPARAIADAQDEPDLAETAPGTAPEAAAKAPRGAASPEFATAPDSPGAETKAPEVGAAPAGPGTGAPAPEPAPRIADAPVAPPAADAPDVDTATAETDGPAADTAPARPQVTTLSDRKQAVDRPMVGTPGGTFGNLADDVRIGRLPSLGQQGETDTPLRPLERFAEPPEAAPDKPLMAIVLIDDGSTPMGLEALESFPYPITFAVDTFWEGAAAAMRGYRDAGFEVMALADLPEGARAQDTEVTLGRALEIVPEAVAVLEGDDGGLQENRGVSDQVARILADSGHGLVLHPRGLNTGQALAARAGVPAATLFGDFDGKGQDATVIRRFLDQAAFKAGQEGAVIMLGRLRAETISALLIWGLQDRAGRVALVPVSTVLLAGD